ncbi:tyrosine-protein phosphatase [Verrucomicrobiaceae bacterium N1E253]|uniref:Tyrosine-protein phosphatase n=1 Tax=Oceaniferula marina TaxID=2748318 RepID=A0A851GMX2_9BACT|nr:tyrosine-protein phosphatase [Oceaniferula marina]NWK56485.1 tyrosine-protein phosphatase [Oceaniferula marina]
MYKTALILAAVLLPLTGCNKKQETGDTASVQKESPPRHIPLDGQSNFRDIGGYQTSDGQVVKSGLIYRSGELPKLSDSDVQKLADLNINSVVSFLTTNEIKSRGEDKLPDGVERLYFPIDVDMGEGTSIDGLITARKTGDFSQIPAEINPDIHRILINSARAPYSKLLRHLINSEQATVYHCSHGVHRTGTATAIILSALGVPWETVRKDYLLSNTYRKEEINKRTEQLKQLHAKNTGVSPEEVDMANINAFYILEGSYIDASLKEAVKEFGSMENYIREGLGISDEEVAKLRRNLLESSP